MPLAPHEEELLLQRAGKLGLELNESAVANLAVFLDELDLWNRRINLVGDGDRVSLIERHLADSLAAAPELRKLVAAAAPDSPVRLADLGSGPGLPGFPLAIACPEMRVSLVEPRRKRVSFLRSAARRLGRSDIEVHGCRVEELPEEGQWDVVTTRATFHIPDLLRHALGRLSPAGLVIAYRSGDESGDERDQPGFEFLRAAAYRTADRARRIAIWRRAS